MSEHSWDECKSTFFICNFIVDYHIGEYHGDQLTLMVGPLRSSETQSKYKTLQCFQCFDCRLIPVLESETVRVWGHWDGRRHLYLPLPHLQGPGGKFWPEGHGGRLLCIMNGVLSVPCNIQAVRYQDIFEYYLITRHFHHHQCWVKQRWLNVRPVLWRKTK